MENALKTSLWKQFGATIEMLENAMLACPDKLWDTPAQFWYNAYHCIFYLDYYLTLEPRDFAPPKPFTLSEFDPDGVLPERTYTKQELIDYLAYCKTKCHEVIFGLNAETVQNRWANPYRDYNIFEILLYNMRHVQHHAAQLNLLLRQNIDSAPRWVSQTKIDL
jgi:hypothetical protein